MVARGALSEYAESPRSDLRSTTNEKHFKTQRQGAVSEAVERMSEAGEPTVAREHVCGPSVILTASVKGAREGARVKIMLVGCPQTAGRASMSGAGLAFGRRLTPPSGVRPELVRHLP